MNRNSIEIHDSLEKSNSSSDFKDIIISNYLSRIKAQRYFDETGNVEKKIGRPSTCKPLNSQNLNSWLTNLIKEKVLKFLTRDNSTTRTDLFCIEFLRISKKIAKPFRKEILDANSFQKRGYMTVYNRNSK